MDPSYAVTWLFVPGDRPDRFDRAAASGADEVVLDLEDAVAHDDKPAAREAVAAWLRRGRGWVRVNAIGTEHHDADVEAVRARAGLRGVVLPKSEDAAAVGGLRDRLPDGVGVVALVESARGVDAARDLATCGSVDRLAIGTVDLSLDLGIEESDEALLLARSTLVLASRLGDLPAPVDGVTVATGDDEAVRAAAGRARALGFGGKLCIHPRQVVPVAEGFRPSGSEVARAEAVLAAAEEHGAGVFSLDGQMVDAPVLARARAVVARATTDRGVS